MRVLALWLLTAVAGSVIELTDASFDAGIKENQHVLVLFYAPWCGHCRQLLPDFERAAGFLKTTTPPVQLAKVDATAEANLAEVHDVRGYPTLKMFSGGRVIDYTGGRTPEAMVQWSMKKVGPAAHPVTDVEDFMSKNSLCVVAYVPDESALEGFFTVANETEDVVFGYVTDASVAAARSAAVPSVMMHFAHDDQVATYSGSLSDTEQLHAFIGTYRLPSIVPFSGDAAAVLFADTRPILFLFTKEGNGASDEEAALKAAAPALLGRVLMSTAGSFEPMDQRLMDYVGVEAEQAPCVRLVSDPAGAIKKYALKEAITADSLQTFVNQYFEGGLPLELKSQEVPIQSGPVFELVGSTFKEIVMDPARDVLVFFYAPWCGHCKKFDPVYKEVAVKLAGVPSLLVAKMDATANDAEGIDIDGFPTIYLYRATKKEPMTYSGDREAPVIIQWLKDAGGVNIKEEL